MWHLDQFEYPEFNGGVHFCCFRRETTFLGKFGLKNKNCQFKLKFGTQTNSNAQNSIALFTFSVLTGSTLFGQISSKKSKLLV